ncbi:MAG: hypothetical protein K2O06_12405 [Acetatifactor sp.]|nr:hypothetical protein [Acetatifactor sp.]
MIFLDHHGKKGYNLDKKEHPLNVELGYAHFSRNGEKDFVRKIIGYEILEDGVLFQTDTYHERIALVKVTFSGETLFRFQMFPECRQTERPNAIFSFDSHTGVRVDEEEDYITACTDRVTLRFRKCPWEMTVFLDGEELTREQIKDFDVGQKYKSIPLGFTVGDDGRITDAFETMYMYCDEAFYGFGEKFTAFNKRGQRITVWQRDAQSTNSDVSYKGMPYFMSSSGYSILMNTYTRTHFNMGASSGVAYTMETEDPYLDYYMFCNRDYKGILKDYTARTGRSPMIPRWAFGFWMSRMSYMNRAEVEEIVEKMEEFGMSADVVHIDGWLDMMSEEGSTEILAFDEKRFPDPEEMIRKLREKGFHLSLWMFPYVSLKGRWGRGDENSRQFELMKQRGYLVKDQDGGVCLFPLGEGGDTGSAMMAALDFSNPECAAYVKERVKRLMRMGVGVIKTDFSEELPETAVYYDGLTGVEGHNKYTYLYSRTIYEASAEVKEEMGEKALIWCRSGYAGSQKYPAHWAGDSSASENNLAAILNGGLSMGISGVSFWGFDIGGFYNCDYEGNRSIPGDEEYIRSVQMGLMSPLSRSHGQSTPREPWFYSREAQQAFLKINKLRYRMTPYLYSTAYETHRDGLPMMRAMVLEYPEDLNVRNLSTQYMLGGALLAAPVFDQKVHNIYLPQGSFVELYTGKRIQGGRWIAPEKEIDKIPLYIRENSMIPMLKEAPMHIGEENFSHLQVVLNLTDSMTQPYYDDGVEGGMSARVENGVLTADIRGMDVDEIRAYLKDEIDRALINGTEWKIRKEDRYYTIEREDI